MTTYNIFCSKGGQGTTVTAAAYAVLQAKGPWKEK